MEVNVPLSEETSIVQRDGTTEVIAAGLHLYEYVISLNQNISCVLNGQYRHDQSRLSTGHGIGVLVLDELSDWK